MKPKKYGQLHNRGNVFYFFEPSLEGKGRGPERSLRSSNLEEAQRLRREFIARSHRGELPNERQKLTLSSACKEYLEHRKIRLRTGSYQSEQAIVRHLKKELGEQTHLRDLSNIRTVRTYQAARLNRGVRAKTVNNRTASAASLARRSKPLDWRFEAALPASEGFEARHSR